MNIDPMNIGESNIGADGGRADRQTKVDADRRCRNRREETAQPSDCSSIARGRRLYANSIRPPGSADQAHRDGELSPAPQESTRAIAAMAFRAYHAEGSVTGAIAGPGG